jgi:hypothetical protein
MSRRTPDSHTFPTREYDLVKEFTIAFSVIAVLALILAGLFSSPDEKSITMADWAKNAPMDVVGTAAQELAGSSASATYGPPYNSAADGQTLLGIPMQKWGGVRLPVNSADLVLGPLRGVADQQAVGPALSTWDAATADQQTQWASDYADAVGSAMDSGSSTLPDASTGDYGPVPALTQAFLAYAQSGGLEGALDSSGNFYGIDATRSLLLLSDGSYLEDQARARNLGGDQWGMMNETGNYPGQPWMWLYTFWYQVPPFSTSDNADALVWGVMAVLTLGLMLLPLIPGLRDIPRWIPVHRLIWRRKYSPTRT